MPAVVRAARDHWPFLVVLALGAAVRVAAATVYAPALFYSDSLSYLQATYYEFPFRFSAAPQGGYPLLIRIIAPDEPHLVRLIVVQHLAGLAIGALIYTLLVRLEVRRWLATVGAAVVLLDAYAIAL